VISYSVEICHGLFWKQLLAIAWSLGGQEARHQDQRQASRRDAEPCHTPSRGTGHSGQVAPNCHPRPGTKLAVTQGETRQRQPQGSAWSREPSCGF